MGERTELGVTGKVMLIDTSKCIACRACQIACQQWHQLPAEATQFLGTYQNPPDMSAANLTIVKFQENLDHCTGGTHIPEWLFFVDRCRHCDPPFCKDACPLGAIKRKNNGIVFIKGNCDPTVCSPDPVKPCQLACPFKTDGLPPLGMPRYQLNDDSTLPDGRANKCDFCYDRFSHTTLRSAVLFPLPPPHVLPSPQISGGRYKGTFKKSHKTACELACPTKAITTGPATQMWNKAKRRKKKLINKLGYPNTNLYPSLPTHVIWILLEDPACYNVQQVGP